MHNEVTQAERIALAADAAEEANEPNGLKQFAEAMGLCAHGNDNEQDDDEQGDDYDADDITDTNEEPAEMEPTTRQPERRTPAAPTRVHAQRDLRDTMAREQQARRTAGERYLKAFGMQGAIWFAEGRPFEECQKLYNAERVLGSAELARYAVGMKLPNEPRDNSELDRLGERQRFIAVFGPKIGAEYFDAGLSFDAAVKVSRSHPDTADADADETPSMQSKITAAAAKREREQQGKGTPPAHVVRADIESFSACQTPNS
jgi:hypothetical protein